MFGTITICLLQLLYWSYWFNIIGKKENDLYTTPILGVINQIF
jgi:hypothetical protein